MSTEAQTDLATGAAITFQVTSRSEEEKQVADAKITTEVSSDRDEKPKPAKTIMLGQDPETFCDILITETRWKEICEGTYSLPTDKHDPDSNYPELNDPKKLFEWKHIYEDMHCNHDCRPRGYGDMPNHFLSYVANRAHSGLLAAFNPGRNMHFPGKKLKNARYRVKRRALIMFQRMNLTWTQVVTVFDRGDAVKFLEKVKDRTDFPFYSIIITKLQIPQRKVYSQKKSTVDSNTYDVVI
eukprot:jgi/Psemu1/4106/gm1.4106_g